MQDSWRRLIEAVCRDPAWRSVMVVGPVDAGKTTLCRALGEALARQGSVAAVDGDPGQSVIGPPSTVGLGWEPWRGGDAAALRFVGATSPARHFLQALTGLRRLTDQAFELGARRVILDSSGYDRSGAGREFQFQSVDLVEPDHLVALQGARELEPLLACFARRTRPRVHRLPAADAAAPRTPARRRMYRERRLREYFQGASTRAVELAGLGLHGMVPSSRHARDWRDRLVGLCEARGLVATLGIVEHVDWGEGRLEVYAPAFEPARLSSVQLGSMRLDRDGRELPPGSS